MFVILNITESGKRRVKKGQTISGVREVSVHAGERFYIVDVLDSQKGVNWFDVASFIGKHRNMVLLDRRYNFEETAPLYRFEPTLFKNVLLFNTAELILKELFLSGIRIKCIVKDLCGKYCAQLRKTTRFAAQTTVVTKNEFRYFAEIQSIYCQSGAGVTLSNTDVNVKSDDFVIDADTCSFSFGNYYFVPHGVEGFNSLRVLCPPYIEMLDFLGAFFELNKHERLSSALCCSMLCSGIRMSISEIIDMIKSKTEDKQKNIIFYV